VTGLRDAHGAGDADPDVARLLYGMALLAEGGELKEPTTFVNTLAERLQKTL
jgi:molecular chaperone HtpG